VKIAVIGAGNVGQALATSFGKAGHDVVLTAASEQSAQEKASEVGAEPAGSNRDAAEQADSVVLAVWYNQHEAVANEIRDAVRGKPVIDVSNPINADMSGLATEGGPSAAERLAALLPDASVVKAFNTVFASVQANPDVQAVTADAFVASDDDAAKRTVMDLAASIGLRPVGSGPLRNAKELEGLGYLGIYLNASNGWSWNTVWKLVGAPIPDPPPAADD
jgi:NADPH-dependent F420 reductase